MPIYKSSPATLRDFAGAMLLSSVNAEGLSHVYATAKGSKRNYGAQAQWAKSVLAAEATGVIVTGTINAYTPTASALGGIERAEINSAAGSNNIAAVAFGSVARGRGFLISFGLSDNTFFGYSFGNLFAGASQAAHNPGVNSWQVGTQSFGIGATAGQTTLHVRSSNGTNATEVNLGASFPSPGAYNACYRGQIYSAKGGAVLGYRIERLDTGAVASGVFTTNLPGAAIEMQARVQRTTGTNTGTASLFFTHLFLETDS